MEFISEHTRGTQMASDSNKHKEAPTSQKMSMDGGPFKTPSVVPKVRGTTRKNIDLNHETTETIPRFLIIKKIDNEDFAKDSPFLIDKILYGLVGKVKDVRKTREGLLVETVSIPQSVRLLKVEKFGDIPVEIIPHKTLNYSKGVITCRDFLNCDDEEILEGMKQSGVIEVKRITTRREGIITNTASLILTFNTPILPSSIRAAFYFLKVRPYIPAPLRCFRCQGFGHVSARCDKEQVCICGHAPHEGSPCKTPITCVNCRGQHSSRAKICPKYQEEQAIQKLKIEQKISFIEARRKIKEKMPANSVTYAQATRTTDKQSNDIQEVIKQMLPNIINICVATLQGKQIPEIQPELEVNQSTMYTSKTTTSQNETENSVTSEKRKRYKDISSGDASESELSQSASQLYVTPKRKPGRPLKTKDKPGPKTSVT